MTNDSTSDLNPAFDYNLIVKKLDYKIIAISYIQQLQFTLNMQN